MINNGNDNRKISKSIIIMITMFKILALIHIYCSLFFLVMNMDNKLFRILIDVSFS